MARASVAGPGGSRAEGEGGQAKLTPAGTAPVPAETRRLFRLGVDIAEWILLDEFGYPLVQARKLIRALIGFGVTPANAAEDAGGFPQEPCSELGMCHDVRCPHDPGLAFGG